jgi:hypothetical protein
MTNIVEKLNDWLKGGYIVSFRVMTGYELEIQSINCPIDLGPYCVLSWFTSVRLGTEDSWREACASLPIIPAKDEPEHAATALALSCLLGAPISHVEITKVGNLVLYFEEFSNLTIVCYNFDFDYSGWTILSKDTPEAEGTLIVSCDINGDLYFGKDL